MTTTTPINDKALHSPIFSHPETALPLADDYRGKTGRERIRLRPIAESDMSFLLSAYAAAREAEKAVFGWSDEQWNAFLKMQFELQHSQYMRNYNNPSFDVIECDGQAAGRFYVDRTRSEIRVIDIVVMPGFRRQGIAAGLFAGLLQEADAANLPLTLHVEHENPIMAYYLRLGFEIRANREIYLFMVRNPASAVEPEESR